MNADDCYVDLAGDPEAGFHRLEWTDCGPGCRKLVVNWDAPVQPIKKAYLHRDGAQHRLALSHGVKGDDDAGYFAVFDETDRPLFVTRRNHCAVYDIFPTATRYCLSAGGFDRPQKTIFIARERLTDFLVIDGESAFFDGHCTDDLYTAYLPPEGFGVRTAQDPSVLNRVQLPGLNYGQDPWADVVYYTVMETGSRLTGWTWHRGVTERILDGAGGMIYDVRSDGQNLAWLEIDGDANASPAPGRLYTSPHATTAAGVERRLVREVPRSGPAGSVHAIGRGYYANAEVTDTSGVYTIDIYRLSDGRHWDVPAAPGDSPEALIWIDDEELWYLTLAGRSIIRQRLDALGQGD